MERTNCANVSALEIEKPFGRDHQGIGMGSWRWISLLALCAILVPMTTSAQSAKPARLVGKIEEMQLDVRPDSSGRLLGLVQGAVGMPQSLAHLSGLLPARKAPMTVCFKARNRDGTYFANGELSAPDGEDRMLPVQAPDFPKVAITKALAQPRPEDLAVMFVAPPCDGRKPLAYPASLGPAGNTITATLNMGSLRGDPEARLTPKGGTRPEITGTCRRLQGRSLAFNVLCEFVLPANFAGGPQTLSVDYAPVRNPDDTAVFEIWAAAYQP